MGEVSGGGGEVKTAAAQHGRGQAGHERWGLSVEVAKHGIRPQRPRSRIRSLSTPPQSRAMAPPERVKRAETSGGESARGEV